MGSSSESSDVSAADSTESSEFSDEAPSDTESATAAGCGPRQPSVELKVPTKLNLPPRLRVPLIPNLGIRLRPEEDTPDTGLAGLRLGVPVPQQAGIPESSRGACPPGRPGLKKLNLDLLPNEDAPKDERRLKQDKLAFFEVLCSEVAPGVCVSGEKVARDRELLRRSGMTHVVNCVGMLVPECFPNDFRYLTLYLRDDGVEDLTSLFYTVFDFMEGALEQGGKVLVHCMQGVSRSVTFVIAFLMWRQKASYEQVFEAVKAIRGVANPNIGFCFQLRNWMKSVGMQDAPQAYVIRQHSPNADFPTRLIASKIKDDLSPRMLEPRAVLLLQLPSKQYIWKGTECQSVHAEAAVEAARLHAHYEAAAYPAEIVLQGGEPLELLRAFNVHRRPPVVPKMKMALVATSGSALNSARSGTSTPRSGKSKTPRTDRSGYERSPQRKMRRSDISDGSKTSRRDPEARLMKSQQQVEEAVEEAEPDHDIGDRVWHNNHAKQFPCLSSMLSFHMLKRRSVAAKADSTTSSQTELRTLDSATSIQVRKRSGSDENL